MADVKWIKMSTSIFDNRKIRIIESLPEGNAVIVIWLKLLCLAGNINDCGMVYFTKEIPYTEQMLATQFNTPLTTIQLAMKTFEQFGMIEIINDMLHISNWEKYQNVEGMDKIREQTRLRVAKHREKQKA
jgi:predicted phage replisome organizer